MVLKFLIVFVLLIFKMLLILWQYPQSVLGALVYLIIRPVEKIVRLGDGKRPFLFTKYHLNVSLGMVRIVYEKDCENTLRHEYGHSMQSLYLGWLYLIVIGVPSFTFACFDKLAHRKWSNAKRIKWYHSLPWERWADRLGGVSVK